MRRALIAVAVTVALAIAAVGIAVPILIEREISVAGVSARATATLGRTVTLEDVGITFRPGLRIRAEGVDIEGAGSADAIEVELAVLPLLRRRIEPAELHLRGARLLLERGPDGRIRMRMLHPPGREAEPGGGGFPALPALEASDGEIVLVEADGSPSGAPVLRIRRLEVARLSAGGRTPIRLELALDPSDGGRYGVGELDLEGFLELVGDEARVRSGRLEGRDLLARGLRIPRFDGRFEYEGGRVAVESLTLEAYGGRMDLEGGLRGGKPPRYQGRVRVAGLALSEAIADWRGKPLDRPLGPLDAAGDVDLRLRRVGRGTGKGELTLGGGALPAGSLFSALLGTIGKLTGKVLSLGGGREPQKSKIERAFASWTLRDDRLHTDALDLVTDDYQYVAAGSVGFDQTLAFSGRLKLTARGAQRMLASASLPIPGAGAVIPDIPMDVSGRLGDPRFSTRATALPSATSSALTGLVRGGSGVVEGAAKGGKAIVDKVLRR